MKFLTSVIAISLFGSIGVLSRASKAVRRDDLPKSPPIVFYDGESTIDP
jgi:hypothetical protein